MTISADGIRLIRLTYLRIAVRMVSRTLLNCCGRVVLFQLGYLL